VRNSKYTIEDEPYFGYMRGRYTFQELKECDDYADVFGIEMIPCIQTLAHLEQFLKWDVYAYLRDSKDVMLAGDDRTYQFIEKMIRSASALFRSKRINICMDEAINLGLGRYLAIHGYQERFGIMIDHLKRVLEITSKYNLRPMMWSDMFFVLGSTAEKCAATGYDLDAVIPQEVVDIYRRMYNWYTGLMLILMRKHTENPSKSIKRWDSYLFLQGRLKYIIVSV